MHRSVAIIKKLKPGETSHDIDTSLIWRILEAGNKSLANELHSGKTKFQPFVWSIEKWEDGSSITFSSIKPEICQAFSDGCQNLANEGIMLENHVFTIDKTMPIRDLAYISNVMRVMACSPIYVSRRDENGKKRPVVYEKDPELWINRITHNLKLRTKAFTDKDCSLEVKVMDIGETVFTLYKGIPIPGRLATIKLLGDKDAIMTAVYGGLGERSGSGFGMVVPI